MAQGVSDDKPVFLLKGVDHKKVEKRYFEGYYATLPMPTSKVTVNKIQKKLINETHTEITNKSGGVSQIIICPFPDRVPLCLWCRLPSENPVGVPVDMDEKGYYIVSRVCCCFECAYAYVRNNVHKPWHLQNPNYRNTESLLLSMYAINHPGKKLCPSPSWEMAEWNQGALSKEEYFAKGRSYILMPTMLIPSSFAHICYKLPIT